MWRRPSLAVAALPLAFAAGVALPRARLAPVVMTHVVTRDVPRLPDPDHVFGNWGSGEDDLDGDGELDCWALWEEGGSCCSGGVLEVRPGCGDHAWRTDTSMSRYDQLQIVKVPTEATTLPLAHALWPALPVDAADSLTGFLIETFARTPDPWTPATGAFGTPVDRVTLPVRGEPGEVARAAAQVAVLTPEEALGHGLVDDIHDTRAVLVARDAGGDPELVASCTDLGESTVWRNLDHLAWKDYGGWWTWILSAEGPWEIDEVACVGRDQVLVRENYEGDGRVIAIDVGRGLRATLAGVDEFEYDEGGADLTLFGGDRIDETTAAKVFASVRRPR